MSVTITLTTPDGSPLSEDEVPAKGTLLVMEIQDIDEKWPADGTARLIGWVPTTKASPMAVDLLMRACRELNK